jgi:ribosomal protein S18 acetylase RimI-like enzyme
VTDGFVIEPLTSAHRRKDFSSGVESLDRYLHELATQDARRRVSNCFVALSDGTIAAFYTLAAASLPLDEFTPEEKKRLPRYGLLLACLIGRLAVDRAFRGRRLGSALIMDAVQRAMRAEPAIFALVVDAKDETAVGFYQHLGFRRFSSSPMKLFLAIETALRALRV